MIFLVHYDRTLGRIIELQTFQDAERGAAESMRPQIELALDRHARDREVVLLDAASEDALRRTHRRYFEGITELATPLGGRTS
jgi:hypothetical protein